MKLVEVTDRIRLRLVADAHTEHLFVRLQAIIDLGQLASESLDSFGTMLKFLLKGLGSARSSSWDLVSYLAFDKAYTSKLLKLGYTDGIAQKQTLLKFFRDL